MLQDKISGQTKVYGVIGDPIRHSLSPLIHNTLAARLNHDLIYVPFPVRENNLDAAIQGAYGLEIQGLNVTMPHKQTVKKSLAGLGRSAREAGAVNTLKYTPQGYMGYNTDIIGVKSTFSARGIRLSQENIVIFGAGGGARAAAMAVAGEDCGRLYIVNRTRDKAVLLARHVKEYYNSIDAVPLSFQELDSIPEARVAIQATSLGFSGQQGLSPVDRLFFKGKGVETVFDIVYSPWETEFLKEAGHAGCVCINGFDMLIYQAVASYEIWQEQNLPNGLAEELLDVLTRRIRDGQ